MCGFGSGHYVQWVSVSLLYAIPCLAIADYGAFKWFNGRRLHLTRFGDLFLFFFLVLMVLALAPPSSSPFIYSRF